MKFDKAEVLRLAAEFDRQNEFWAIQEREIGERMRANKVLKKEDLVEIIEWKFGSDGRIKAAELRRVAGLDEQFLLATSKAVFGLDTDRDLERIELLCCLRNGIGASVANVILTFYDPANYGILDFHVWDEIFNERRNDLTSHDYVRLLNHLRNEAKELNLQIRTIEKTYFIANKLRRRQF